MRFLVVLFCSDLSRRAQDAEHTEAARVADAETGAAGERHGLRLRFRLSGGVLREQHGLVLLVRRATPAEALPSKADRHGAVRFLRVLRHGKVAVDKAAAARHIVRASADGTKLVDPPPLAERVCRARRFDLRARAAAAAAPRLCVRPFD